jgi:hypothetical protein
LKGGDSTATPIQIARDLNRMVGLVPWTSCVIPAALTRWSGERTGKDSWFGGRFYPNWYLPVHLGGLGLDIDLAPSTMKVTKSQRLMAARFFSDPRLVLYRREGVDIPTAEFAGALAKWKLVPGSYVPRSYESTEQADSWLALLCQVSRATFGATQNSDKVMLARFKPEYRLKPMSLQRLKELWHVQFYASSLPVCPPLGAVRLSRHLEWGSLLWAPNEKTDKTWLDPFPFEGEW